MAFVAIPLSPAVVRGRYPPQSETGLSGRTYLLHSRPMGNAVRHWNVDQSSKLDLMDVVPRGWVVLALVSASWAVLAGTALAISAL